MASYQFADQSRTVAETDWRNPESVGEAVRALWGSRAYKSDLEQKAYRNQQFIKGKQWWWWREQDQEMVPRTDVEDWRAKLVYNKVLPTLESRKAKLIRNQDGWTAIPASEDESDRVRQRTTANVMSYYWTDGIPMPERSGEYIDWAQASPIAFARPFWNPRKGPLLRVSVDDFRRRAVEQSAGSIPTEDAVRTADNQFFQSFGVEALNRGEAVFPAGDPDVAIHPIFEVIWWPFHPNTRRDVRIWMVTEKMTIEDAAFEYGISPEEIRAKSGYSHKADFGYTTSRWGDEHFWKSGTPTMFNDDCVLRHLVYKEPTPDFPLGRVAVSLGLGGWIVRGPMDINNPLGRCPIIPLVEKPIPGQMTGTCIVDQIISAQEDRNMAASQISDYRNRKVMPTLVDFVGNPNTNKQSLSNKPGKIYRAVSPDKVPQVVKMPDIGFDYFQTIAMNDTWIADVGGIAGLDVGRTDEANVRSGRAIIALREQNDLRLVPFAQAIDTAMGEIGEFVLAFVRENVKDERLVKIIGENNELEVVSFRGDDLKSAYPVQGPFIKSGAHSVMPRSPTEMLNIITVLSNINTENGMLSAEDRNTLLDALGVGDLRSAFDKRRPDAVMQSEEIKAWEKGQTVGPPGPADDDAKHIEVIDRWMKSLKYRRMEGLAKVNPAAAFIVKDILEHRQGHQKWMARKLAEARYLALDGDLQMWMKHRAGWLMQIQEGAIDPNTAQVVLALYNLPLSVAGMGATPQQQQDHKQAEKDQKGKPQSRAKKARDPNGTSPRQGVKKNE